MYDKAENLLCILGKVRVLGCKYRKIKEKNVQKNNYGNIAKYQYSWGNKWKLSL